MAEHSPGPWHVPPGFGYAVYDVNNVIVAQVPAITQGQANAQLIADAWLLPELVDAAKMVLASHQSHPDQPMCSMCSHTFTQLADVLAKVSAS